MKQATTIPGGDTSAIGVNSSTLKVFERTAFGGYPKFKRGALLIVWAIGLLVASFSGAAQDVEDFQAEIKFEKTSVNLGEITPDSGKQKFEFKFLNSGNAPLVLTYVHASCSCIGVEYPRTPIAPGDSASISGFLNPGAVHETNFKRNILIRSNATPSQTRVFVTGKLKK